MLAFPLSLWGSLFTLCKCKGQHLKGHVPGWSIRLPSSPHFSDIYPGDIVRNYDSSWRRSSSGFWLPSWLCLWKCLLSVYSNPEFALLRLCVLGFLEDDSSSHRLLQLQVTVVVTSELVTWMSAMASPYMAVIFPRVSLCCCPFDWHYLY